MTSRVLLYVFVLSTSIGCSSSGDSSEEKIVGEWQWLISSGGIAGVIETPESTGKDILLQITPDSIKQFSNDELQYKAKYDIIETDENIYQKNHKIIVPEDGLRLIIDFEGKNLILTQDCFDCFANVYERVTD